MVRLVLHEVRYVLIAMFYSTRCLTAKIQNSLVDNYIYWFLTLIPTAMLCVPQFAYLLVDSKGLIDFVSVLVPFTEILLTNLKMIICNIKREKIIKLINEIQAEWTEYQKSDQHEIQSLITSTAKKTRIFVIIYTASFVLICLEYASMPLFKFVYFSLFSENHANFTVTIPYSSRFFFSTDTSASFSLTYFFVMIAVYMLALTLSGFDSLFATLAMHITTMFQFLKIEIDQLGLDMRAGTGRAELRDKMKRIILKHKTNLSLIEELEDGFSFYLMVQFLTSSFVVCVVFYELTIVFGWNEDTFKTLTYLPGAILQLYLFCWYAQNITEEARLVSDHIYNTPWYLCDLALQKTILTFMVKAQKPTGVTASKFYMVTLQSFQRISSTSYSYFTLLQTINQ
ncbi:odorant receptor 13a-like [Anopheles stephensi]|uniref:odorant receptor 13a-like n=1 Tax=Anopheles stephensi TaxID=30069 RepID=UPI00165887E7|nr:odorant receptor 13a-like [Anopheles stephensi]